jgi:alkylation response protein AidB-like acyl-CoA dehydrogenase
MDLDFNDEQIMMAKTVREFVKRTVPKTLVREMEEDDKGFTPEIWKEMATLGWVGCVIPEEYGGVGGSFLDLAVLLEEMGRALLPSPFLPTMTGIFIIVEGGTKEQKQRLLPQIAEGKLILTPAWSQPSIEYDITSQLTGVLRGSNYVLSGSRLFVPYANAANYLISQVYTTNGATTLFLVDTKSKGLNFNPLLTMAKDKQFEVEFDNVAVPQDDILGELNNGQVYLDRVLPKVLVLKSIEMLGGAQQVLEMTTEYAKQRVQFGQPIGSFQAVQHHCANMAIDVEASRFLAYKAAWLINQGLPCTKEAYMTKAWVSDAYRRIVVLGKQIHGGYGVISEYDLQLYLRRQQSDELFMGDADFYRGRIANVILCSQV